MQISEEIKQRAYGLDHECWISYTGMTRAYKQQMEVRRQASLVQAARDLKSETEEVLGDGDGDDRMLLRVRASLQARLEGRNEGGDIEVMRLVDEIVEKAYERGRKHGRGGWI